MRRAARRARRTRRTRTRRSTSSGRTGSRPRRSRSSSCCSRRGSRVGATISPHVAGLERADPRGRRGGRLRGGGRARAARGRAARRDAVRDRDGRRPRGVRATPRWTWRSWRRASAGGSTRRTSCGRASSCSRTSGSSTRTSSATRVEEIAREKLAVAPEDGIVVLPGRHVRASRPRPRDRARRRARGGRGVRRPRDRARAPASALPGRFERRDGEIRDGAHNPDGVRYLVERLRGSGREVDYTVVASILADKDADAMLRELRRVGSRFVATRSSSERALARRRASPSSRARTSSTSRRSRSPAEAVARAHELGRARARDGLALPAGRPRSPRG